MCRKCKIVELNTEERNPARDEQLTHDAYAFQSARIHSLSDTFPLQERNNLHGHVDRWNSLLHLMKRSKSLLDVDNLFRKVTLNQAKILHIIHASCSILGTTKLHFLSVWSLIASDISYRTFHSVDSSFCSSSSILRQVWTTYLNSNFFVSRYSWW